MIGRKNVRVFVCPIAPFSQRTKMCRDLIRKRRIVGHACLVRTLGSACKGAGEPFFRWSPTDGCPVHRENLKKIVVLDPRFCHGLGLADGAIPLLEDTNCIRLTLDFRASCLVFRPCARPIQMPLNPPSFGANRVVSPAGPDIPDGSRNAKTVKVEGPRRTAADQPISPCRRRFLSRVAAGRPT